MAKKKRVIKKEQKTERLESLFRLLVLVVSGLVLGIWRYLVIALAIINFAITIVTGKRHIEIAEFSEYWNTEYYKYFRYLTFVSNKRPFPFSKMEKISEFNHRHHHEHKNV